MKRLHLLVAAVLVAAAAPPPSHPPFAPEADGKRIVYRHANLIDGSGAPMRADMAVVTDGPLIRAVVPDGQLGTAQLQGAEQVDLRGRYLLPGLIDSHQHLATPPDRAQAEAWLRRDIYSGITAIRDMADDLRQVADLARAARVGEIPSPDIGYAALMAGPSFFSDPRTAAAARGATAGKVPWMQSIDDHTDLADAVTLARGTSAIAVKIYANLPARLVARIAAEAHRQNMLVWAHGMVFPATPAEVAAAGPDTMSHVCYLAYQAMERRPASYQDRFAVDQTRFRDGDNPAMTALFRDMKRRGIILDATLRVYAAQEQATSAHPGAKPPYCSSALAAKLANQAWREGVTISTGTDGESARTDPYPALYDELELLATKAGIPPAQVIRSATLVGAMTMKRQAEMGTIAPGKLANMVVVERNPLEAIGNLRSVLLTIKRGRRYPRLAMQPISAAEVRDDD